MAAPAAEPLPSPPASARQHQQQPTLGLELKRAWCERLLSGGKTVELRRYPLPPEFAGRRVLLLATPDGCEGKSTLPEHELPAGFPGAEVAGSVVFDGQQTVYLSEQQFEAEVARHCVPPRSLYGWQPGVTTQLFGWHVAPGSVQLLQPPQPVPAMRRVLSSWFETVG